jgi:Nucleotidyltransferase domain
LRRCRQTYRGSLPAVDRSPLADRLSGSNGQRGKISIVVTDERLRELVNRLISVPGVVAVALGGSRARGTHTERSDIDLGMYYRGELDTDGLGRLARDVAGPDATVTRPEWGPRVDGGGWLQIETARRAPGAAPRLPRSTDPYATRRVAAPRR